MVSLFARLLACEQRLFTGKGSSWLPVHMFKSYSLTQNMLLQNSYGSWKTWKVLGFYYGIFQDWKVLDSSGNLLNTTRKFEVYGRQ